MGKFSLKQWIVAGTFSGVLIGISLPVILLFLSTFRYTSVSLKSISPFLSISFVSNILLGIIMGVILFFLCDKLPLKKRLYKCVLVSIAILVLAVFFSVFFRFLVPITVIANIAEFYMGVWMFIGYLFGTISILVFLFLLGIAFGFLIDYFLARMERKASK